MWSWLFPDKTVRDHTLDDRKQLLPVNFNNTLLFKQMILRNSMDFAKQRKNNPLLDCNYKSLLEYEVKNQMCISNTSYVENFMDQLNNQYIYHGGYLHYLLLCAKFNCGAILGPCHIWNIVIYSITKLVDNKNHQYDDLLNTYNLQIELDKNIKELIINILDI